MTDLSQKLRQLSLFQNASDDALEELASQTYTRLRHYAVGEIIARQGASVASLPILLEGTVRAQMMGADGRRLTMDTLEATTVLASAFVYSTESKFPVAIEAIEPASVLHIDKEFFLLFMGRYPAVMRAFLEMISDRCNFLSNKINALNLQSLRERLLSYARRHRVIGKQVDLALLLGVTRPALARMIAELVDENILYKDEQGYKIRERK